MWPLLGELQGRNFLFLRAQFDETDTVTPDWLTNVAECTTTERAPLGALSGICTFSCTTPLTKFGAVPAYTTFASNPLIRTLHGIFSLDKADPVTTPSSVGGISKPPPVA